MVMMTKTTISTAISALFAVFGITVPSSVVAMISAVPVRVDTSEVSAIRLSSMYFEMAASVLLSVLTAMVSSA